MKTNPNDMVIQDPDFQYQVLENNNSMYVQIGQGLTKREYFAALMLQRILAGQVNSGAPGLAVHMADQLIKELNKEKEST